MSPTRIPGSARFHPDVSRRLDEHRSGSGDPSREPPSPPDSDPSGTSRPPPLTRHARPVEHPENGIKIPHKRIVRHGIIERGGKQNHLLPGQRRHIPLHVTPPSPRIHPRQGKYTSEHSPLPGPPPRIQKIKPASATGWPERGRHKLPTVSRRWLRTSARTYDDRRRRSENS